LSEEQYLAVIILPSSDPTWSSVTSVTSALAAARRDLATQWMELNPADVQRHYAGRLGRLHRLFFSSGLRDGVPLESDRSFIVKIKAALDNMQPHRVEPGKLLAAMLFLFPHELPCFHELTAVPAWLVRPYVSYMLAAPRMLRETGEAKRYLEFATRWVSYLHDAVLANPSSRLWRDAAILFSRIANFNQLYFNSANLRQIYSQRAAMIEAALAARNSPVDYQFGPRASRDRLRLGIIATHFGPTSETYAMIPMYRHIDRTKFEVILLAEMLVNHPVEQFCAQLADDLVVLPDRLGPRVQAIRQADLDLLLIGTNTTQTMNGFTLLAAHRLARVQVANVCSCTTTGLRNVDYFLSGRLSEPADAQSHYSERLLMIDGPAHCYDFSAETDVAPTESPTRESLGIPAGAVVFASGANFFKIIPEVQETWLGILAAMPEARLVLYPFNPNWSSKYPVDAFMERLSAAMLAKQIDSDRVIVLSRAPNRADILQRLRLCDVYLDSFPFCGATSLLDPLEAGLPPVVMDGATQRGLQGPALLRAIGLDRLIVRDPVAYAACAIDLAGNASLRDSLKRHIDEKMKATPSFLDGKRFGAQVASALERMWREYETGSAARVIGGALD
jgi:predicted O-linked N-acetylglucosamine transferase (SPINDLY family)